MTSSILLALVEMFILMGLGVLARKLLYIDENDVGRWSKFIIDVLFPVLIFQAVYRNFDVSRLGELWPLPLIGFGFMAVGALIGIPLSGLLKSGSKDIKKTFLYLSAINNYATLPIFILMKLSGEEALANLFFLSLGSNIGFWTIGVGILGGDIKSGLKGVVSPVLVALVAALLLSFFRLNTFIPDIVVDLMRKTGDAAVYLAVIIVGATIKRAAFKNHTRDILLLTVSRLVIIPLITIFILKLLRLPSDMFVLALVVSLMPASASSPLITRRFGGDPEFAGAVLLVSTLLSALTIPFLAGLFLS
jgi:malate permease and related proteins